MTRWFKRIAAATAAVLLVSAVLAFDFVRSFTRSLPVYDGEIQVAVAAPVTVLRDRYAVPHISARSFDDAAFALGYVHAQDRLWQMELTRRAIRGRLAEMFGAQALPNDRMMRSFGLYRAAQKAVPHLSPQTRRALQRYADGVNAYLRMHKGPLPLEFTLAGVTPAPWTPADSVAVLKGMALTLSGNAFGEAARIRLMGLLGRKSVSDFFAPFDAGPLPAYLDSIYGATRMGGNLMVPDITASNNWVVDGAHSVTGKPLLANDPHLGFTLPSTWYLAHLSFAGEDIAGGTLAGIPAIITGQNRHVAWGLTNTGPDTQDLYLERLNPDNRAQYQTPSGWASFDERREIIQVRFGADTVLLVRETRHGPVMDTSEGAPFAGIAPKGYVVALAWTALAPDDTTMDTLLGIGRAHNAGEFRAATRASVSPMQNVVYADDENHIGLVLPGRVPIRAQENDSLGLVPAPGWDPRYDWQGFVPRDASDIIMDPLSGRIVTANNKVVPETYPFLLTREWEPPYRHDRIDRLLAETSLQSAASFAAIQRDIVDTYALSLKQRLMRAAPFPNSVSAEAAMLADWDGTMRQDRPEPLIFAAWARALARRLYADELGDEAFSTAWGYRAEFTLLVLDDVGGESRWCDDRTTLAHEDCPSRIRAALEDAVAELSRAYGPDPKAWRWGTAHKSVHAERPLSDFPLIGRFFRREAPMDGGPFTVMRADNAMASRRPYAAVHGAGYRGVYDLSDSRNSRYIVSTGQSGNVYSAHYDDLLPLWTDGRTVAMPFAAKDVAALAAHRLILEPQPVKPVHVP